MGGAKRTANIGGGASDLKREEKLQAVVLADVCARKLRPATFDGPKALMPLANVPLLEYTLEFLCAGGVEEVFVFACHGAEAIDAYLRTVEPRFHPATLRCIASRAPCFSAGDALREVFEANVIQGEFVLAPGDVVTNLSLPALVAAHRAARESDKDTLLTACFARVPYGHRIRACDDSAVLVIDSLTGRLLHYEPMPQGLAPRHAAAPPAADADAPLSPAPRVQLPLELLEAAAKSGSELRVRADLLDLRIDVCTLEVLTLLVDNFDWGELRTDMLTSVLSSDILCKTVHVHEMGPASLGSAASAPYAARATDWRTYAELTADVLARWTFPMVPDSNLLGSMDAVAGQPGAPLPASAELGSSYRQGRGNLYTERDVSLARSSQLGVRVLLGGGSSVGADACVSRSVLGRRCVIGDRAVVVDSVLWAGVRVGEGARVHGAVLCEGVQVGPGAHVGPGCILGRGVVVGAGVRLAPRTLFTRHAARALKPGKGGAEEADEEAGSDGGGEWAEGDEDSDDAFSDDEEEDKEGGLGAAHAGTPPDGAAEAAHALGPGGIGFVHAASAPSASFACARPQPRLPLETDTSDDGGEGEEGAAAQAGGSGDVFVETALDILAGMLEDGCARLPLPPALLLPAPCRCSCPLPAAPAAGPATNRRRRPPSCRPRSLEQQRGGQHRARGERAQVRVQPERRRLRRRLAPRHPRARARGCIAQWPRRRRKAGAQRAARQAACRAQAVGAPAAEVRHVNQRAAPAHRRTRGEPPSAAARAPLRCRAAAPRCASRLGGRALRPVGWTSAQRAVR